MWKKLFLTLFLVGVAAAAKPSVVLLANSVDYELGTEFLGFLRNGGLDIIRVTAENFEEYKEGRLIVILGGPDSPEGVGEIVSRVLGDSEKAYLRQQGNRRMYVKSNKWKVGQVVMVLAGYNRYETQKAWKENKEEVLLKGKSQKFTVELLQVETDYGHDTSWDMKKPERLVVSLRPLYDKSWRNDYELNMGIEAKISDAGLSVYDAVIRSGVMEFDITLEKPEPVPQEYCGNSFPIDISLTYKNEEVSLQTPEIKLVC